MPRVFTDPQGRVGWKVLCDTRGYPGQFPDDLQGKVLTGDIDSYIPGTDNYRVRWGNLNIPSKYAVMNLHLTHDTATLRLDASSLIVKSPGVERARIEGSRI